MDNEECITVSLVSGAGKKNDHLLQKPNIVAVLTGSCYDEDETKLSRLREMWGIPNFKIYEPHITLAASYWNEEVASLKG